MYPLLSYAFDGCLKASIQQRRSHLFDYSRHLKRFDAKEIDNVERPISILFLPLWIVLQQQKSHPQKCEGVLWIDKIRLKTERNDEKVCVVFHRAWGLESYKTDFLRGSITTFRTCKYFSCLWRMDWKLIKMACLAYQNMNKSRKQTVHEYLPYFLVAWFQSHNF